MLSTCRSSKLLALAIGAALLASSCEAEFSIGGNSVERAAVGIIEDDFTEQLGIDLVADCPEVPDPEIGTTFVCTATTPDGRILTIDGVVDSEDHIDMQTLNLLSSEDLDVMEQSGVDILEPQIGPLTIDCGQELVILPADNSLTCTGEDGDGDQAPIVYTFSDLRAGDFTVRVDQ